MQAVILGRKLGMTSFFKENGDQVPCTVIEAGPCPVVQLKTSDVDGYTAVQIGFEQLPERLANKPLKGHFEKAGLKPMRHLKEFRGMAKELNVGEELKVDQFTTGDKVVVTGTSLGRGFQGVVKRHHFGGVGMGTHGQSDRQRHPGSVGASSYPSRVVKGIRMGGRMGGDVRTIRNIEIIEIIPERNLMLIKGSVPGPKNTILEIVKQ